MAPRLRRVLTAKEWNLLFANNIYIEIISPIVFSRLDHNFQCLGFVHNNGHRGLLDEILNNNVQEVICLNIQDRYFAKYEDWKKAKRLG